jgi:cell wall assembly regulator SMI1
MGKDIERLWKRIDAAIAQMKTVKPKLKGPATERSILAAERSLGVSFPDDVRASLRVHDGQPSNSDGLFGTFSLLSAAGCAREARIWNDLEASGEFKKRPSRWKRGWIPLTSDGGGDSHCVDGKGRIILVRHDADDRPVVATSFRAWLTGACEELERDVKLASVPAETKKRTDVPSMDQLMTLLGRSINDAVVRSFLGSYKFAIDKFDDSVYYVNNTLGFDLMAENRTFTTLFLYLTAREGHQPFTGTLSRGLRITDTQASARRKLGKTERRGEDNAWDRFKIGSHSVRLAYHSKNAGIRSI